MRGKYAASQAGRFDHTSNTSRKYSFHPHDFCLLGQEQLNGNEAKLWEIRQANKVGSDLNYSMRLQKYSQKKFLTPYKYFQNVLHNTFKLEVFSKYFHNFFPQHDHLKGNDAKLRIDAWEICCHSLIPVREAGSAQTKIGD